MSKIDFAKVEEHISQAVRTIFVKKILHSQALLSDRAIDFYNLQDGPRPRPRDPTDAIFEEIIEMQENSEIRDPYVDTMIVEQNPKAYSQQPDSHHLLEKQQNIPTVDKEVRSFSVPFYIEKHLQWFQSKKIKTIYQTLGTSKQELSILLKKEVFSEEEVDQLQVILKKLQQVREEVLQAEGKTSDQKIIDLERNSQKSKRLNVRDKWLTL